MTAVSVLQLMATGVLAGLIAGFIGLGGGAILTPLCLLIYPAVGASGDELIKIIFGTNMFLVMVFATAAVVAHRKSRDIDWRTLSLMGPLAIAGSFLGGSLASMSDPSILRKAFAVLLLTSSTLMVVRGPVKPGGSHPEQHQALVPRYALPLLGLAAGTLGAFLGIGGGVIMVPALMLLFGVSPGRVAAVSSSVIIFIGFSGMISYMWNGQGTAGLPPWSTGYVWWAAALPIAATGIPAARMGARLNARANSGMVQRISGGVLLVVALKLLLF